MDLFYIRLHYQSIVRSSSFSGEIFALIILSIMFASSISFIYEAIDNYALLVSDFFGLEQPSYKLFLILYIFVDLLFRLVFRRPLPKLKYYVLWGEKSKAIAWQYLITSLFGLVPFLLAITMVMMSIKAGEWLGTSASIIVILWWFTNHFIGLISQFYHKSFKPIFIGIIVLILVIQYFLPSLAITTSLVQPIVGASLLLIAIAFAFVQIKSTVESRHIVKENEGVGFLESLPTLSFKNPIIQLEWALLVRNKRTRSNLAMGLVSVLIFPFLLDQDDQGMISALIFFIVTGFFIIQHGVYSLGWEGSYFDFLLINIPPKSFIKTRYAFYAVTCVIGLTIALIPTIIKGLDWTLLLMLFLYNVGVTIPFVLYRSTFNSTKIILTENAFMNYNGMLTGPIMVTSLLITVLPVIFYSIAIGFFGSNAIYILGLLGVAGLMLSNPITNWIAKKYQSKKYHLSQSFKS